MHIFLSVLYPCFVDICTVRHSNKGNAEVATLNGKVVGAANVGQMFTQDIYFWGRPSAGNYTADASGGSNKDLRTMNTWQKWKPVSILFWYIILI